MEDIRDCLKKIIKDGPYNQSAIARKAALTPDKLSAILNKSRRLEANEMINLCEALGITPDELMCYSKTQKE